MIDLVSVGSPIDAMRSKWAELPSIREVVPPSLIRTALPITSIAQRALLVYKTFFPNLEEGVSALGTLFSWVSIGKLGIAIPGSLSDLASAVQRTQQSIHCKDIPSALYHGFLDVPTKLTGAISNSAWFLLKTLPPGVLSNYLPLLSSLGYGSLFMLFVLGLLNSSYHASGKSEFEEKLESLLAEARLNESEENIKKFDEYLAEIAFGKEIPGETSEQRKLRFQEKKESFIRWTNLECYKNVADMLGVTLSLDEELPNADAPINIQTYTASPETLSSRAELFKAISRACFKVAIADYFKSTMSALSTAATFALLFYAEFFLVSAAAVVFLLLVSIAQFREDLVQDLIISQFQTDLPG